MPQDGVPGLGALLSCPTLHECPIGSLEDRAHLHQLAVGARAEFTGFRPEGNRRVVDIIELTREAKERAAWTFADPGGTGHRVARFERNSEARVELQCDAAAFRTENFIAVERTGTGAAIAS